MPSRARSVMERFVMSWPFQRIWPEVGWTRPMMTLARVVLPPPLGPVKTMSLWSGTVRETPFKISSEPPSSWTV